MDSPEDRSPAIIADMVGAVRSRPWITFFMVALAVMGAVLALLFLGDQTPPTRRVLLGAIGGVGTGMLIFATRMIGAFDDDEDD